MSASATPTTRLDSITWTWGCAGQQPLTLGSGSTFRTLDLRKVTVEAFRITGDVVLVVEGPVVSAGKYASGRWHAATLDPTSDRVPPWVRCLVESVARGATELRERVSA